MQWWKQSALQLTQALTKGQVDATQVLNSHLERLDEINSKVNAVVVDLREDALQQAQQLALQSETTLPLYAVPILTKINSDQRGTATSNGLVVMKDNIAEQDSPQIANLKQAGSIVFGRSNAPEFSLRWQTDNPLYGRTINPWNDDIVSGGSSGGAGVAVATGICSLAHGSDLGGSLRYPAYCNGVVSLKSTHSVVPEYCGTYDGEWPHAMKTMHVQGAITRTVADARIAFNAMRRYSPNDPSWIVSPEANNKKNDRLKIAISTNPGNVGVHPAVANTVLKVADILDNQGHEVHSVDELPRIAEIPQIWARLINTELAVTALEAIKTYGSNDIQHSIESWLGVAPPTDLKGYLQAWMLRTEIMREWQLFHQDYDFVVTSCSSQPPMLREKEPFTAEAMEQHFQTNRALIAMSFIGMPAAVVPTELWQGMPLGIQISSARFRDWDVLDLAESIEAHFKPLYPQLWQQLNQQ